MARAWILLLGSAVLFVSSPAEAQQSVFGYQLALNQSVATTLTDDQQLLGLQPTDPDAPAVSQLQGLQLNTGLNANITYDIATRRMDHAFLLGVAFNQLIPTATPEDAPQQDMVSGFNTTATYLARVQRARWGFSLGGGYTLASNGRLATSADGGITGQGDQQLGATLPGQQFGPFVVNGLTHSVNANMQLQQIRARWDMDINANYAFTKNGVFTLAPGAIGGAGGATALGAFVPVTTHTINPQIGLRRRFGIRNLLAATANVTLTSPLEVQPVDVTDPDTGDMFQLTQQQLVSQSALSALDATYTYEIGDRQTFGILGSASFNFRVPLLQQTDEVGNVVFIPDNDTGFAADTFIYQGRLLYNHFIRSLELDVGLSAGVAQPRLWQFPIGQGNGEVFVEPTIANIEPVFTVGLTRRFNPIDVTIGVQRDVQVGGLGASAIVTEGVNLTLGYQIDVGRAANRRAITMTAGATAARIRSAGAEFLPVTDVGNATLNAVLNDNNNVGALANINIPLIPQGQFTLFTILAYNFAYNDLNPSGEDNPNILQESTLTHNFILTLAATFGRGALENVGNDTGELDAFSRNPTTGSPLTSARLLNQGVRLDGTAGRAPGRPAEARRDSRQAFQQGLQEQATEQESRALNRDLIGGAAPSNGQILDSESADAATEAEQNEEDSIFELAPPAPPPEPEPEPEE